ncbi:MAG: alpha-amylase family glycosyl hydrolase [Chitinophagaceae bacterium]
MKRIAIFLLFSTLFSCKKSDTVAAVGLPSDPAQYGSAFTNVPSGRDASVYQVNMRAFSAAGNLKGVTARLDSIRALGINVIYLMPIYPVGILRGVNSPYAVKDYKAVGAEFGTLDDLRALVDGAHSRNMAVILDWVANHTAWDNAWISNKSWYKQDASGNIVSPSGYTDVAQLDFNNTAMRTAMIEAMRYWIFTANVDGYRCDFADNDPFDFWKQAVVSLNNIPGHKLLLIAEGTRDDHYRAGFQMKYGFSFFNNLKEVFAANKTATSINTVNASEYVNSYDESQVLRYTTNHDVNSSDGTPLELFGGKAGSMAAFVVTAYMKGVPMVYNGQEVATSYRLTFPFTAKKIDWTVNPDVTAEYKKILAFRNTSAPVRRGQLLTYSSDDVCAFTKQLDIEKIFVLVNLRNKAVEYTLPVAQANSNWSDAMKGGNLALTTKVTLQPYAYWVLKNP